MVRSGSLAWLATRIEDAGHLDLEALRSQVARAYAALGEALSESGAVALRLWNYLPNPGTIMAPGLDRYMIFNAGRYDGYGTWFPGGGFERVMPTATAIGVASHDLTIHCLASATPGHPIQNPRQRPAWEYSARYGPLPPAFSRGTVAVLNGRSRLLIGGTASIVGEDSMHVGDIDAQLQETLNNLAAVVAQAVQGEESRTSALARLTHLRVYVPRTQDAEVVHAKLRACCARSAPVEMMVARLCRPELLVEIEGVADVA